MKKPILDCDEFDGLPLNIIYLPGDEAALWSSERANTADNKITNFIVFLKQFFHIRERIQSDR